MVLVSKWEQLSWLYIGLCQDFVWCKFGRSMYPNGTVNCHVSKAHSIIITRCMNALLYVRMYIKYVYDMCIRMYIVT